MKRGYDSIADTRGYARRRGCSGGDNARVLALDRVSPPDKGTLAPRKLIYLADIIMVTSSTHTLARKRPSTKPQTPVSQTS